MNIQNQYLLDLASKSLRIDKRKPDDYREITIEKNPIEKAEGSARIKLGETDVIVGVKMEVGKPFPDKLDEGVLITGAEFSPLASPEFETGPPREEAIELARVVDRGIRESGAIDTKKLCIEEGEKVWMIYVDIHIINHQGNLMDAATLAAVTALHNTKIPKYDGKKVIYEEKTKSLPIKFKPVSVTISKINEIFFLDCSLEEEEVSSGRITITTKDDGNICAMQKSGISPFSAEEINRAIEMSIKKGEELRKLL